MADLAVAVEVAHRETKIGDTLCTLPLIRAVADLFGANVHLSGAVCPAVMPLIRDWPVRFDAPPECEVVAFRVDVQAAYELGWKRDEHIAATICRMAHLAAPDLPADLNLSSAATPLPRGIVLSPFSGSSNPWYKAWPQARWLSLARHLALTRPEPVIVIGGAADDMDPFRDTGVFALAGLDLPAVLGLMRQAALFVSIDNGPSHLAHFGAVRRHVLLYPELLPPNLVAHPGARTIRAKPERISLDEVIDAIERELATAFA